MLHLAAGQLRPDAGGCASAAGTSPACRPGPAASLGLARTFQVPQPFSGMTVYENVLVGATFGGPIRRRTWRRWRRWSWPS